MTRRRYDQPLKKALAAWQFPLPHGKGFCRSIGIFRPFPSFFRIFPSFSILFPPIFKIKCKKVHKKFARFNIYVYLCNRLRKARAFSSAGLEHLPYKQRVGGSNPSTPTGVFPRGFLFGEAAGIFLFINRPPLFLHTIYFPLKTFEMAKGGIIQTVDTPKSITKEDLLKQIHRAEIKLKGISTMIANLHTRKDEVQEQIGLIARQFGQDGVDNADLAMQMSKLRKELDGIDEKLALRQKMLDDANATITEAKQRLAEMRYEHSRMKEVLGEDRDLHSIQLQRNMLATFNNMLVSSLKPLVPTLTDRQQDIVNESSYSDLTRNCNQIINCAMLLSLGYIREATAYAESCGGGSSPGTGWGRDKNEDDEHWWRRCIAVSSAMMRPAKYRVRRGR